MRRLTPGRRKTHVIQARVTETFLRRCRRAAEADERTLSGWMTYALAMALDPPKRKRTVNHKEKR